MTLVSAETVSAWRRFIESFPATKGERSWLQQFFFEIDENLIQENRWWSLLKGLGNTLKITLVAVLIGVVLGVIVAAVCSTYEKNKESMARRKGVPFYLLKFLYGIFRVYLTVIRGTPSVVQLLIMFFIIFKSYNNGVVVASITFGINSGAYVAEIFRGGILSVDNGQFEAGRSLGFNYVQTMRYIIIPQAFKNVLPALGNEAITLLKETSIAGYVAVYDLTKVGDMIRSRTYDPFVPLLLVAACYLVMVLILSALQRKLERRLRKNER